MESKYKQIVAHIKDLIEADRLKSGSKTPSIMELCIEFNCNKATVIRAYDELQKQHLIYSVPKSGFYVVEKGLKSKQADDLTVDFSSASPAVHLLPYQEFQHCIDQALTVYKDSLFRYSGTQGLTGLRKTLKRHLMNHQIFTEEENIFITSGAQQALNILSLMPFPNGKRNVLIEQPTYLGMKKALEINNITAVGINRDAAGIDMNQLERIFRNDDIKFFYTMPRLQNPTGFSLSNEQKRQIIELAEKYDVYIVEDDYLADLEGDTKACPIGSFGFHHRVVYVKTFSKILLPGIRLCALVLPKLLTNLFLQYKVCSDYMTNTLSQGALEIFLKSGMYDNHIKNMQKYYLEQMSVLKNVCARLLPSINTVHFPKTGFFTCMELPVRAAELEHVLSIKGVHVVSTETAFLPEHSKNTVIRLSISNVSEQQISRGIEIIAKTIQTDFSGTSQNNRIWAEKFI